MKILKLKPLELPEKWYDEQRPGFCSKNKFRYSSYHLTDEVSELVQNIFPTGFFDKGRVGVMAQKIEHGFNGDIHKDTSRLLSLNYMIDKGVNDAHLELYDENKTLQSTYCQQVGTWCVLETQKFHAVRNVETPRLSITVQFFEIEQEQLDWINAQV